MADDVGITVDGLDDLKAMFDNLSHDSQEKAIRKALRAGGEIEMEAVVEATPVRIADRSTTALPPGALKSDVQLQIKHDDDGSLYARVGFRKYTYHVARWVADGHRRVVGGYRRKGKNGEGDRGPGKVVGEVEAHPFVSEAFEASAQEVESAIADTLVAEIIKASKGNK